LSVSSQPPYFRGKLLHHALPENWHVEPVRLPRAKALDSRVAALDPAMSIGNLTLYIASTPLEPIVETSPQADTPDAVGNGAADEQQESHEPELHDTPEQSLGEVDDTPVLANVVDDGATATTMDASKSLPAESKEAEPLAGTQDNDAATSLAETETVAASDPVANDESAASDAASAESSDGNTHETQLGVAGSPATADKSLAPNPGTQIETTQAADALTVESDAMKDPPVADAGASSASQAAAPALDVDAALAAIDAAVGAVDAAQANL